MQAATLRGLATDRAVNRRPGVLSLRFGGESVWFSPTGSLCFPHLDLIVVSDLHLGRSERHARLSGALLPPFETDDTLCRLETDIAASGAGTVICLGDSFDDCAAAENLSPSIRSRLRSLAAGRNWIWIAGNHDPELVAPPGDCLDELYLRPFTFRHEAAADPVFEISGHYHPKASIAARGRRVSRPCFLMDSRRVILPAFGTYTGGLDCGAPPFRSLFQDSAVAILTGRRARAVALPPPRRQN